MGRKNNRRDLSGKQGHSDGIQPPAIRWDVYDPDPYEPVKVWKPTGPERAPAKVEPVKPVVSDPATKRVPIRERGPEWGGGVVRAEEVGLVGRSSNQPSRSPRLDTDTHAVRARQAHPPAVGEVGFRSWVDQCRRVILKIQRDLNVEAGQHELAALRWIMAYATAHQDSSKRPVWVLDPDELTRERVVDGILLHVGRCRENVCAGLESAEAKKFWGDVMTILNGPLPAPENARLRKRPYECATCGKRFSESGLKGHQSSDDPRKAGHTGFKVHR